MAVIPTSQMVLMRKRKQLHQLIQRQEWDNITSIESELYDQITTAVEDPARSSKELLAELGSIIGLYKELSSLCYTYSQQCSHPEH